MKTLTFILLLLSFYVLGDVYKIEAPDGRVYYTDTPKENIEYKKIIRTNELKQKKHTVYAVGKTDQEKKKKLVELTAIFFPTIAEYERIATRHNKLKLLGYTASTEGMIATILSEKIIKIKKFYILNGGSAIDIDNYINQIDLPISLK